MEGQGGVEVRRLHIVYFLSRKGRIEHPHLIRVHHLSRNGVRLRDIKRWLGELRGKEMSESFSWSYKRRYKTGYVWQDLLDDDLITPISDNEYVLKGSEIFSTTITEFTYTEEKFGKQKDQEEQKTLCKDENQSHSSDTSLHVSTKSLSEIEEELPSFGSETSTLTDDSGRVEMEKISGTTKHEKPICNDKIERSSPFYSSLLSKKNKSKKVSFDDKISTAAAAIDVDSSKISSSEPQCTKSKNHSNGASQIFRNLISCGDVETNDFGMIAIKKKNKRLLNICSSDLGNVNSAAICKRDSLGGSQRIYGNPNWTQQQWSSCRKSFDGVKDSANKNELRDLIAPCAAYKPVNGPNCSQCGKPFKPEKLHAHMKSCKGLKALSKCAANAAVSAAAEKASNGPADFRHRDSLSGHLLIQ